LRNAAAVVGLVVRRAMGHRRLLATVFVGVVLAAALLASVSIYADAIRDLGLSHALRDETDRDLDLRILSSSQTFEPSNYAERRRAIGNLVNRHTQGFVASVVQYGRSDTFFLTPPGGEVDEDDANRPRANFHFIDRLEERVELVEGTDRAEPTTTDDGYPLISVWVGREGAEQLGVSVGDVYDLHPFWIRENRPIRVQVAGIVEPIDPRSREWYGIEGKFVVRTTSWPTYPFWVDEETLTGPLVAYLGTLSGTFDTYGIVDRGVINSGNADTVAANVRGLATGLREQVQRTTLETTLGTAIERYQERLFFTRLPLFALMLQVVGIVLYYLVMVSTMLVDRQTGEIALLRSRGASTGQVMGIYAIEGGILAGAAIVAGPLFAAAAISILGLTPPFSDLSGGSLLEVTLSPWAFGLAALGAFLAMAALLVPAYVTTRKSMVQYRQNLARPPQQPVFLRYYLDLVVVGVAAYAFYQLQNRGSLVTDRLFGGLAADPLLLVAPTLFMLMVALVFLRIFPLVLGAASWAGRGLPGATIPLGLWHMVRSPSHYGRLILLLLLATAVGMFAAGFRATLERSYDDRTAYEAGAEGRIQGVGNRQGLPPEAFQGRVAEITGASLVTPTARVAGTYQQAQFDFQSFEVLGVVPGEFDEVATWRGDFASRSLGGLLSELAAEPAIIGGATIASPGRYLGFWLQPGYPLQIGQPGIRLRDAEGSFWDYRVRPAAPPDDDGWIFFYTDLLQPFPAREGRTPDLSQPLHLNSLYVRLAGAPPTPQPVSMLVTGVAVSDSEPSANGFAAATLVEAFGDLDGYAAITGVSSMHPGSTLTSAVAPTREDQTAARIDFVFQQGSGQVFGLRARGTHQVLPVVVSNTFLDSTRLSVGDRFDAFVNRQYITLEIVDNFRYFPTWDPDSPQHLLVANLDTLVDVASRVPFIADGVLASEVWIGDMAEANLDREFLSEQGLTFREIFVRSQLRAEASADPLVAASWEGILFLSFAAVLLLTALGFVVYSYLTAQTRSLEFAILRTMGFSGRQILGLVSFEQVFVIASGVLVGTLLGTPLGRLMIGYMGITETGAEILPPLVSRVSWGAVVTVYSLLAVVFVLTVLALVALYSRLAVHRALRMGEL
jgi:putative ABC transport system permease protein